MRPAIGASGRRALVAAVIGATASSPAMAVFNDYVELWAAENLTHDSNVFRLSDKVSPSTVGASQRGDTIYSTYLGIAANVPVAQQRFEAAYTWNRSKFQEFGNLDYTGHTARAAWDYNLQNKVTGVLSYNESQGLASFNNIQANEKDLVTVRQAQGTAAWLVTPRWRMDGRLTGVQTEHTNVVRSINDIESEGAEAGLSYVTPQENLIGGSVRYEHGKSPHGNTAPGNPFFGLPFTNEYDQWGVGATTTWNLTGHSRFDGRLEVIRRRYNEFTSRNYQGPALRALYRWTPTPKTTVDVGVIRDIGPPEEIQTSFVLVTGGYVRPKWAITEKITLQGNVEYNVWDYRGDAFTGGSFTHHQRLYGGSVQWKPWERVWLQVGVNREVRTSTLLFGDYETTVAFVEGRVGF